MSAPEGTFPVSILDRNLECRREEPSVVVEEVERLALLLSFESTEIGHVFTSDVPAFSMISTSTLTTQL